MFEHKYLKKLRLDRESNPDLRRNDMNENNWAHMKWQFSYGIVDTDMKVEMILTVK